MSDDPLRMFLVVFRGGVETLEEAAVLGGAAAVACLRRFEPDPEYADVFRDWRPRPGKVCLRARSPAQWEEVLEQPHEAAGGAVAALPPRRRSERGPALERVQAMATDLGDPPTEAPGEPGALTYVLNPRLEMSSGKVVAQVAHAAVMAADALPGWSGSPARLYSPPPAEFDALRRRDDLAARVVDAGLTEVPPGTVTVLAVAPALRDDRTAA